MARREDAEHELLRYSYKANRSAMHHRALHGEYGYERILGVDLVERCLAALNRKGGPLRVLDVGCGDGWALHQLEQDLRRLRPHAMLEFYGLGMNRYPMMYVDPDRFLQSGINQLVYGGPPFDVVMSVFTFHYIWHKIEAVEKIYNHLLALGGEAFLHFPGYLMRFDGAQPLAEDPGNAAFASFAESFSTRTADPVVRFFVVPYLSDDDDGAQLGFFGVLRMTRSKTWLDCGLLYEGCELVPHRPQRVYVSSRYVRRTTLFDSTSFEKLTITRTLRTSTAHVPNYEFDVQLDLCVHRQDSPHIVINYPGAFRDVDGFHGRYKAIAAELQDQRLAATVRVNNPFIRNVDYPWMLTENLRYVIDYVLERADEICGHAAPSLYLLGHSAGASAMGAIASRYPQIRKMLLLAPSLDAGKEEIRNGLRDYAGELYVVVGMNDEVVLPVQSSFFCHMAVSASVNRFVALWHCDHDFSGARNYDLLRKAPRWAFFGDDDFPDDDDPFDPQDLIHE